MPKIKDGKATTELGVLGLVSGLLALNDKLMALPPHVLYTIASLAGVYIVCRTALKMMACRPASLVGEKIGEEQ